MKYMAKVAVYTSPRGRPKRQVGAYLRDGKSPNHIKVRFPNDQKTYTFHARQVRPIKKTKVLVSRKDIERAVHETLDKFSGSKDVTAEKEIEVICEALGL